jgi:hypothetical protein
MCGEASSHYRHLKSERSMKKTVTKRKAWTKENHGELKALAKKKWHASKIAKRINRTEAAVRQRASVLGISLDSRR